MNTPEIEMLNKKPMITLMREVQLTSLINKQHNIVNDVGMETNEHMILEELLYEVAENHFTRTEIVLHTKVIRTTSAEEMMDQAVYKRQADEGIEHSTDAQDQFNKF